MKLSDAHALTRTYIIPIITYTVVSFILNALLPSYPNVSSYMENTRRVFTNILSPTIGQDIIHHYRNKFLSTHLQNQETTGPNNSSNKWIKKLDDNIQRGKVTCYQRKKSTLRPQGVFIIISVAPTWLVANPRPEWTERSRSRRRPRHTQLPFRKERGVDLTCISEIIDRKKDPIGILPSTGKLLAIVLKPLYF